MTVVKDSMVFLEGFPWGDGSMKVTVYLSSRPNTDTIYFGILLPTMMGHLVLRTPS